MSIRLSEARSIIRKAKRRVPEGESVSHLNLTAMMDMMSILLVFMIKSMATAASPLNIPVKLPPSSTRAPSPEEAKTVTISKSSILVEGEPVVGVKMVGNQLDVDPSEKTKGSFGIEITKLTSVLAKHHEGLYKLAALQKQGEPEHELTIIADKEIPYRLLYTVLYTAGQAKAENRDGPGFQKYRLIVVRNEE